MNFSKVIIHQPGQEMGQQQHPKAPFCPFHQKVTTPLTSNTIDLFGQFLNFIMSKIMQYIFFLKTALFTYNLHAIYCTHLKCTIQRFLVYSQLCNHEFQSIFIISIENPILNYSHFSFFPNLSLQIDLFGHFTKMDFCASGFFRLA